VKVLERNTKLGIAALVCCGLYTVPVLLGCTSAVQTINRGTQKLTDPLNDAFGTSSVPPRAEDADRAQKAAKVTKKEPTAEDPQGALEQTEAFDIPRGWSLVNFIEESEVYQLTNEDYPNASLVVQYKALGEGDATAQHDRLVENHDALTGRLPDTFRRVAFSETFENDRPMIVSRYLGTKGEGEPEMFINGYSVAIGQDSFVVFAAYLKEHDAEVRPDVDVLLESLRPKGAGVEEVPVPEGEDPPPAPPAEEPVEEEPFSSL
jgi:hypothetical protein